MRSRPGAVHLVLVALFAALTAAGALFSIPIGPVPVTLQSMISLMAGSLLGPTRGALSQAVYVTLGLIGLPVFSGSTAGIGCLFGPTGGYLVGFVAGSFAVGSIASSGRRASVMRIALAMVAGLAVIYACGVAGLVMLSGLRVRAAITAGVLPFLPGDAVKVCVAVAVVRAARPLFRHALWED